MDQLDEQLRQLVGEACQHPPGSPQRQKNLTKIIRLITNKLWKENTPYYQDALQQTWIYFCQNICAGKINTGEPYNQERGTVITWLNFYLKKRLLDLRIKKTQNLPISSPYDPDGERTNPIERIPAEPDIPPLLEEVKTWVETDPTGELRRTYISSHPEVTCQVLILRRLPPETSWKDLSAEYKLSVSTLSSFYQRQCLPRLRKFGESEGYLE